MDRHDRIAVALGGIREKLAQRATLQARLAAAEVARDEARTRIAERTEESECLTAALAKIADALSASSIIWRALPAEIKELLGPYRGVV